MKEFIYYLKCHTTPIKLTNFEKFIQKKINPKDKNPTPNTFAIDYRLSRVTAHAPVKGKTIRWQHSAI